MEACLPVLGSKTRDTDLGIIYSKSGLDDATADKFSKINKIKTTDNDKTQQSEENKTQQTKFKHKNIPSCDLSGKSL